jgi:hypothetical protein
MNETEFKQLKNAIAMKMGELRALQQRYHAETGREYLALGHRTDTDVTGQVEFGDVDGEFLEVVRCLCGHRFEDYTAMSMSDDYRDIWRCDECGARLYFKQQLTIWEKRDDY